MRIVFVRHAQPNYELDRITETGHLQAAAVAERLVTENITEIYASPMGRARQTAGYTAEKLGLPVTILEYMPEIDWGSVDGKEEMPKGGHPWMLADEMARSNDWDLTLENWKEHPYFRNNKATKLYEGIAENIDKFLAGHGYVREGFRYLCTGGNTEKTIALFSHGGSGACALSRILNLPLPYTMVILPYDFTSVTIVNFPDEPGKYVFRRLELFNDVHHFANLGKVKPTFDK